MNTSTVDSDPNGYQDSKKHKPDQDKPLQPAQPPQPPKPPEKMKSQLDYDELMDLKFETKWGYRPGTKPNLNRNGEEVNRKWKQGPLLNTPWHPIEKGAEVALEVDIEGLWLLGGPAAGLSRLQELSIEGARALMKWLEYHRPTIPGKPPRSPGDDERRVPE
jgi:hypothetical protein